MAKTRAQSAAVLTDTSWALHRLLQHAASAPLTPSAAAARTKVIRWLDQVDPLVQQTPTAARIDAPAFPLSSGQLRELEEEIARLKQGRHAPSMHARVTLDHLHASLSALQRSSYLVLTALLGAVLLNVAYLSLLTQTPRPLVITGNLVALAVALGIWALHHVGFLGRLWESFFRHAATYPTERIQKE